MWWALVVAAPQLQSTSSVVVVYMIISASQMLSFTCSGISRWKCPAGIPAGIQTYGSELKREESVQHIGGSGESPNGRW